MSCQRHQDIDLLLRIMCIKDTLRQHFTIILAIFTLFSFSVTVKPNVFKVVQAVFKKSSYGRFYVCNIVKLSH